MSAHPLRRRYGLELGLGLALAALVAWFALGREPRERPARTEAPAALPQPDGEAAALEPARAPELVRTAEGPEATPPDSGPSFEVALGDADGRPCADAELQLERLYLEHGVLGRELLGRVRTDGNGRARLRLDETFRGDVQGHVLTVREPFFPRVTHELPAELPPAPLALVLPAFGALAVQATRAGVFVTGSLEVRILAGGQLTEEEARASLLSGDEELVTRTGRGRVLFPQVGLDLDGWLLVRDEAGAVSAPTRIAGLPGVGTTLQYSVELDSIADEAGR